MDPAVIFAVFATFLFAAFLKGTSGLGFATTCLGIMASYMDMRTAILLVIIPSLLSNAMVMIDAGDFLRVFKRFRIMFAAAMPGLILGLWILGGGDTTLPRAVLGLSMICYGIYGLWGGRFSLRHTPLSATVAGFATGLVNGLTGSQIMPILPYLMALDITKDELIQAINTSFTISSVVMLAGLGKLGLVTTGGLVISVVGIVPVYIGIWLGGKVRRLLPESAFRRIVLALIVVLGTGLVYKAFA